MTQEPTNLLSTPAGGVRSTSPGPRQADAYAQIAAFYDHLAELPEDAVRRTAGYHRRIRAIYSSLVPEGQRVLEIGCGRGDLLAAVRPSYGLGIDVSHGMIEAARRRHPDLEFECTAGEALLRDETFDYILLSDLVPFAHDLQALFSSVARHCHAETRVIANTYSNAWRPVLALMTALGLRERHPIRNWVAPNDLTNLAYLADLEVVTERNELLLPLDVPVLSRVVNGVLARLPGVRRLTASYWMVARPLHGARTDGAVSVIVPCRNEAGSIEAIVERIPDMGLGTEIVFVEGHSSDDTRERIAQEIARRPDRDMRLLVQTGKGKGNAVREGFAAAKHDILMILDADLTVAPEDLPKFYEAVAAGRGELINGTRLIYGMDSGAMRFLNLIGNKFFASLLSFVLGQYVKDTLCGTKVLRRSTYERIDAKRHEFVEEDPYGDFDLLLGAGLHGLKIVNIPVRYGARTYGDTNIQRFSGGTLLLRLAVAGFRRIWIKAVE